jgi:nuclear receptor co-repressor 1
MSACPSDTNGGRSDTDEACIAEMDSAICSTQSFAKTEMDGCPTEIAIQGPSPCIISHQMEGNGSKDCGVLDVKTEEGENKADKTCTLDDQKRFSEVGHRSACGPIDINCPETTEKLEGTDDTVDQMNVHDNSVIISSKDQHKARMDECSHPALDNALKAGNSVPSASIAAESGMKENVHHFSKMTGASSVSPASTSSYQHSMPGDMSASKPKPQVTPLTPKDLMPVQFSSVLPDPTSIRFEGIASITTPNFEDTGNRACNALEAKDLNKYPAFNDQSQSGQHDTLFRNIDVYTKHQSSESPIFSERNTNGTVSTSQSDRFTVTKFQNARSRSLGLPNTTDGNRRDREHKEMSDGTLRPCSRNTSSEGNEQIKRPGDVKLFGQILSHQSSLQNSGSSCNGSKSKPSSPNADTSSVKLLNNPRDRVSCSSRAAVTGHLGLDDRLLRSYGHLDGSAPQPEPLLVMAKCPTSLSGVPFYSAKNGKLGVFSDYQQPLMQVHQSDPKRLERYSDPHKRNGMEFISGFQQPVKGSRFGGAGILVSGVSDPVAALKAQYGPGSKITSCDVDPWKDIGSR